MMPVSRWIRRLALAGALLGFCVVVLGAYVRLSAAGLGCPDWPGCYGHLTPPGAQHSTALAAAFPDKPLDAGKAWREMIHRYAASTLGLICVGIALLAVATRRTPVVGLGYASALLGVIVFQGALGMLTVTWQLTPLIVTLHLLFGITTLGLMWWLLLSVPRHPWGGTRPVGHSSVAATPRPGAAAARALVIVALCVLGLQIALGGWTSSNYAAVACPDFPKCQNAWWPHTDYRNAFMLWRGLGTNYEGGVLDNPARVAIHLTHRLGALAATVALTLAALVTILRSHRPSARMAAAAVLAALGLQLAIGIAMVERGFPLWLATAHNAGATLLVLATLALVWSLSRSGQRAPF